MHDGSIRGEGLEARNSQDITSGVYLFTGDPDDGGFSTMTGKFVVIR